MERFFSPSQISLASQTFCLAERIAGQYFGLGPAAWKGHHYDVKTLAYLNEHEVREGAFAHLCRYEGSPSEGQGARPFHFYRICLQDNRILDAVERAHSFIRLSPLLLYIAAHELVHVVRFERGEGNFEASAQEKESEEEKVHWITRRMLKPVTDPGLKLVLECFSGEYRIGDFVQD